MAVIASLLSLGLMLSGFGLLLYHAYEWARFGVWATYSSIQVLLWIEPTGWAMYPRDWMGVHAFLSWLPLWALCFVGSLLATAWAAASDD